MTDNSGLWRNLCALLASALMLCGVALWNSQPLFYPDTASYVRGAEQAPQRFPHLTGHLIDMGPGTRYLQQNCPGVGYAACEFVQNYPTHWVDFLFSTDPDKGAFSLADGDTKRRLSAEQTRLFFDVLRMIRPA